MLVSCSMKQQPCWWSRQGGPTLGERVCVGGASHTHTDRTACHKELQFPNEKEKNVVYQVHDIKVYNLPKVSYSQLGTGCL